MSNQHIDNKNNDPQRAPVVLRDDSDAVILGLKIESVEVIGRDISVRGWAVGDTLISLEQDDLTIESHIKRNHRGDVADALQMNEPDEGFGFSLSGKLLNSEIGMISISVVLESSAKKTRLLKFPIKVNSYKKNNICLKARLHIDEALYCPSIRATLVTGWSVADTDIKIIVRSNGGREKPLFEQSIRFYRPDIFNSFGKDYGAAAISGGFAAILTGVEEGDQIMLIASRDGCQNTLNETTVGLLPNHIIPAAQTIFGIHSPISALLDKFNFIDYPILNRLIQGQAETYKNISAQTTTLGTTLPKPKVSIVVPLFGRTDFVEHQLIEFSRDSWLQQHAEILYVMDDPALVESFTIQAQSLYRLYKIPFQWVWGGANRGFSGANNLGAQFARGTHLLFMNSDVIPQAPGWLQPLVDTLTEDATLGAVGPRLTFADGSIQHAGMTFVRREELGIWANHHPNMGLDPSLDPIKKPTRVPAITGACILMRRKDFDHVDGWDTGYLIGDFEDSDICLKLRSVGLEVAYHPGVQLTHLERQSFKLLGEDGFRHRVMLYNAARHQSRWGALIEASVTQS